MSLWGDSSGESLDGLILVMDGHELDMMMVISSSSTCGDEVIIADEPLFIAQQKIIILWRREGITDSTGDVVMR